MQLVIRQLGQRDYTQTWQQMQEFTEQRDITTPDELWFLQHLPVFTQGRNGRAEHLLDTGDIPVIQADRGGQVTYHGPGQLVVYTLIDIRRRQLGVQSLVRILEQAVINLLQDYGITGKRIDKAPGVYVSGQKLAALGLRVRKGCAYHGLALNVNMDMTPFTLIDPCGYRGLEVTQLHDLGVSETTDQVSLLLRTQIESLLNNHSHERI